MHFNIIILEVCVGGGYITCIYMYASRKILSSVVFVGIQLRISCSR